MTNAVPVIYSKPGCSACTWTKIQFDEKGLEYTIVDITKSEDAYNEVVALGYQQMPVVYASEDNHWSGRNPQKIAELAAA